MTPMSIQFLFIFLYDPFSFFPCLDFIPPNSV